MSDSYSVFHIHVSVELPERGADDPSEPHPGLPKAGNSVTRKIMADTMPNT